MFNFSICRKDFLDINNVLKIPNIFQKFSLQWIIVWLFFRHPVQHLHNNLQILHSLLSLKMIPIYYHFLLQIFARTKKKQVKTEILKILKYHRLTFYILLSNKLHCPRVIQFYIRNTFFDQSHGFVKIEKWLVLIFITETHWLRYINMASI